MNIDHVENTKTETSSLTAKNFFIGSEVAAKIPSYQRAMEYEKSGAFELAVHSYIESINTSSSLTDTERAQIILQYADLLRVSGTSTDNIFEALGKYQEVALMNNVSTIGRARAFRSMAVLYENLLISGSNRTITDKVFSDTFDVPGFSHLKAQTIEQSYVNIYQKAVELFPKDSLANLALAKWYTKQLFYSDSASSINKDKELLDLINYYLKNSNIEWYENEFRDEDPDSDIFLGHYRILVEKKAEILSLMFLVQAIDAPIVLNHILSVDTQITKVNVSNYTPLHNFYAASFLIKAFGSTKSKDIERHLNNILQSGQSTQLLELLKNYISFHSDSNNPEKQIIDSVKSYSPEFINKLQSIES